MAGGSFTGLNGVPRDPRADARIRRALARLGQTNWLVSGSGVYLNASGQIEVQLANDTLIIVTETGLEVNTASATAVIANDVFQPHATPKLPSQALIGYQVEASTILAGQIFGG